MDVQGKVVIITGASMGIGEAAARVFAQHGAKLVLAARSVDKLEQLAAELRQGGAEALVVCADMLDAQDIQHMVEAAVAEFGRVDVLINNAGQAIGATVETLPMDGFRQIMELNVFAPVAAMQAAIPHMRAQGSGLIVNISSMVTKRNIPTYAGYASSKAALNMLSLTANAELAAEGIKVLTVYPGYTITAFRENALATPEIRQRGVGAAQPNGDTAEFVAEKILLAVQTEAIEQYMDR